MEAYAANQRQDVDWVALVRNVVGSERMRSVAAKLVAVLDDVAVKAKEDDVAVVAAKDVVVALRNAASKRPEALQTLA